MFSLEGSFGEKQMESIGEDFYCQKQIGMVLTRRQELPRKMAPIKRRRSEEKRDLGKTVASDVTGSKRGRAGVTDA
jgi:hypothetical protein